MPFQLKSISLREPSEKSYDDRRQASTPSLLAASEIERPSGFKQSSRTIAPG